MGDGSGVADGERGGENNVGVILVGEDVDESEPVADEDESSCRLLNFFCSSDALLMSSASASSALGGVDDGVGPLSSVLRPSFSYAAKVRRIYLY